MKKHIPLIVGIALPIILIIVASIVIFLPSTFINPAHNFLYSQGATDYNYHQYNSEYVVKDGKLTVEKLQIQEGDKNMPYNTPYKDGAPPLYTYDVKTSTSHKTSLAEAQQYMLDPGPSSVDGYTVRYEYGNNGIFDLFGGGGEQNGLYVEKGDAKKKLTGLSNTDRYYSYNGDFKFIGWIK